MFYWRSTVPSASHGGRAVELFFTSRRAVDSSPGDRRSRPGATSRVLHEGAAQRVPGSGEDRSFGGFNLGGHVGDVPDAVEANREQLAAQLGVPRDRLLFMRQVHGTAVSEASGPWADEVPECDGLVTRQAGLALAVLVADCVPVLLHDSAAGVVAAVHAGRPGMTEGIVGQAVDRMRDLGAEQISAVVGPSVCGRCYEVPADLREKAARTSAVSATVSWTGTPAIDVAGGVVDQLRTEGVAVHWLSGCTREHPELYSYRRDGRTGRFAGVVVLRETDEA